MPEEGRDRVSFVAIPNVGLPCAFEYVLCGFFSCLKTFFVWESCKEKAVFQGEYLKVGYGVVQLSNGFVMYCF